MVFAPGNLGFLGFLGFLTFFEAVIFLILGVNAWVSPGRSSGAAAGGEFCLTNVYL